MCKVDNEGGKDAQRTPSNSSGNLGTDPDKFGPDKNPICVNKGSGPIMVLVASITNKKRGKERAQRPRT